MFDVVVYPEEGGDRHVFRFLDDLRGNEDRKRLWKLVLAVLDGTIAHPEDHEFLVAWVDPEHGIGEACVTDIDRGETACVLLFPAPERRIVLTNGYLRRGRRVDPYALELARECKARWEARHA